MRTLCGRGAPQGVLTGIYKNKQGSLQPAFLIPSQALYAGCKHAVIYILCATPTAEHPSARAPAQAICHQTCSACSVRATLARGNLTMSPHAGARCEASHWLPAARHVLAVTLLMACAHRLGAPGHGPMARCAKLSNAHLLLPRLPTCFAKAWMEHPAMPRCHQRVPCRHLHIRRP